MHNTFRAARLPGALTGKTYGLAVVFALLLTGCASTPSDQQISLPLPTVTARSPQLTAAQRENGQILASYGGHYENPPLQALAEKILARLRVASERPDLKYQVTILNSPAINAFALPDGQLYITRGLITLANDESELASVLAHEMGHVIARHAAIREEQAKQVAIINRVVNDVLSDPNAGALALAKSKLALANFSRAQEFEADELGIRISARASYDPFGGSRFLTDMQHNAELKSSDGVDKPIPDFFSNHPATPDRVQNALAIARQFGGPGIAEHNRGEFLSHLDGIVYGVDPGEGFVRGRRFVHPKLGFSFIAPPGFTLDNTAQAVFGVKDGGAEALRLDVVSVPGEQSLPDYLKSGWMENIDHTSVEELTINGFPAAMATASDEQWSFRLYALRFGSEVYRFMFATKNKSTASDRSFRDSIMSFRRMSSAESKQIHPLRVKIVSVGPHDTPEKLARRMAISNHALDVFRMLNGLAPNDRLKPGEQVKLVVE